MKGRSRAVVREVGGAGNQGMMISVQAQFLFLLHDQSRFKPLIRVSIYATKDKGKFKFLVRLQDATPGILAELTPTSDK